VCVFVSILGTDLIQCLLDHRAEVEASNHHGQTPLHIAAGNGRAEAASFLIVTGGADSDARDNHGGTPADAARANNQARLVEVMRRAVRASLMTPRGIELASARRERVAKEGEQGEATQAEEGEVGQGEGAHGEGRLGGGGLPVFGSARPSGPPSGGSNPEAGPVSVTEPRAAGGGGAILSPKEYEAMISKAQSLNGRRKREREAVLAADQAILTPF